MPYLKSYNPRIVLIAGIIVTVITLLAGASIFAVMERHAYELQSKNFQLSLDSRIQLIASEIGTAFNKAQLIATNSPLIDILELVNKDTDAIATRILLNKAARSFAGKNDFMATAFSGENGQIISRAGSFTKQPELSVQLNNFPGHVQLIWDGRLLLRSVVVIKNKGRFIGKVITESPLTATMAALKDANRVGVTGELVICIPLANAQTMQCLPTVLNPNVFTAAYLTPSGVKLPMAHALEGNTGFIVAKDHRDHLVTAAYAPVGDYGLGIVLKIDNSELNATVSTQLSYVVSLMILLLTISLLLLRWLITPLVLKLTESANHMSRLNDEKDQRAEQLALVHKEKDMIRQETDKTKSQFISTVSHELRTPLTSIKGALGLIQAGFFNHSPEKLQSTIQMAYRNTERLHKLIDNILDTEQLETGAMVFDMHSMDLSALVQESVLANAGYGSEYGVNIVYSGTEDPLMVTGDYGGLMQVVGNLLSNAIKFSPRGGQVEAIVSRYEGRLRVTVTDNGCGIPEKARDTLFDKFTQVDSSDQRQKGGSGLGLNIVKAIVEQHDGHIDYTSEVGKGSTFYVDLAELTIEGSVTPLLRILLVDDQALFIEALSALITAEGEALGVQVVARVGSASEALIQVQNLKPDLVLMDMHMPEVSGTEAVGLIKRDHPNTKILMLSGADSPDDVRAAKAAGADGYAYKSDTPKSLIDDISKVMSGIHVFVSKYKDTI
jgi:signal transduction histidine kinase/ActR/RegA family two-component response regulator